MHSINRVTLDFSFSKNEKDEALKKVKQLFYDEALPVIDKIFSEYNGYLQIDRMEVDLGTVSPENFNEQFFKSFIICWRKLSLPENRLSQTQEPGAAVNALFFFLEKGYWPWNMQRQEKGEWLLLLSEAFRSPGFFFQFNTEIKDKGGAVERLLNLLDNHVWLFKNFVKQLLNKHPALPVHWIRMPGEWRKDQQGSYAFFHIFFETLVAGNAIDTEGRLRDAIIAVIKKYLISRGAKADPDLTSVVSGFSPEAGLNEILKEVEVRFSSFISHKKKEQGDELVIPFFSNEASEKISIANAGLILLYPYLRHVFRELKWVDERFRFRNDSAQQKAILFLQFVVNGRSRQDEHELVLNKILCNWPLHKPMRCRCNFSRQEKAAATEMIASLIEHWKVLKNTSVAGFIKSFIGRQGLIQKKGDGFVLQVQAKSIDLLLEDLPFGLQIIKLPWNEYIIHAEWQY